MSSDVDQDSSKRAPQEETGRAAEKLRGHPDQAATRTSVPASERTPAIREAPGGQTAASSQPRAHHGGLPYCTFLPTGKFSFHGKVLSFSNFTHIQFDFS